MPTLSRPMLQRVVWVAAVLLLPLPYVILADGAVPVVRFAFLAAVVGAYAVSVGTSPIGWTVLGLLAAHALVYAGLLWVGARLVVRALPMPAATLPVIVAIVAAAIVCAIVPVYHTPFDAVHAYGHWWSLVQ